MARILIAEDERDIRELIAFTLRFAGHEVIPTANGEEAVQAAIREVPDLILLDVRMPRLDGYEACIRIKAAMNIADKGGNGLPEGHDGQEHRGGQEHRVAVPIVFLSAKGQESEIQAGLEAGATEYLLKPFSPDELIGKVDSILNNGASTAKILAISTGSAY